MKKKYCTYCTVRIYHCFTSSGFSILYNFLRYKVVYKVKQYICILRLAQQCPVYHDKLWFILLHRNYSTWCFSAYGCTRLVDNQNSDVSLCLHLGPILAQFPCRGSWILIGIIINIFWSMAAAFTDVCNFCIQLKIH